MTITVFGNPVEPKDSLAVSLVPELEKEFPEIIFEVADPTENVEPAGDPWVILDVAIGIEELTVIEDLHDLEHVRGQSVHDYDVYMELKLREKLGMLPKIKIILIPNEMKRLTALSVVSKELRTLQVVRD